MRAPYFRVPPNGRALTKLVRTWNLGNLLVWVGTAGLLLSFWWPYVLADRVARIEGWGENIGRKLLAAALEVEAAGRLDLDDPTTDAALDAVLGETPEAERIEPVPPPAGAPPGVLWFRGKHYAYLVGRTPADGAGRPPASRPIEVCVWPLRRTGPGRDAFVFTSDGLAAFTRNQRARYDGFARPPQPGWCRPRDKPEQTREYLAEPEYRSAEGEIWTFFPDTPYQ